MTLLPDPEDEYLTIKNPEAENVVDQVFMHRRFKDQSQMPAKVFDDLQKVGYMLVRHPELDDRSGYAWKAAPLAKSTDAVN